MHFFWLGIYVFAILRNRNYHKGTKKNKRKGERQGPRPQTVNVN